MFIYLVKGISESVTIGIDDHKNGLAIQAIKCPKIRAFWYRLRVGEQKGNGSRLIMGGV